MQKKDLKYEKIFLIGMMGCGKTYWGKRLSKSLEIPVFDLDNLVEKSEGNPISRIFEKQGEHHFRERESALLKQFETESSFILSTGGGTPCFFDNMAWMNKTGITIWIDEQLETLLSRLQTSRRRPLLKGREYQEEFLRLLLAEREPFYSLAQFHLQSPAISMRTFEQILCNE